MVDLIPAGAGFLRVRCCLDSRFGLVPGSLLFYCFAFSIPSFGDYGSTYCELNCGCPPFFVLG
jgi:hypothetical protein